MGNPRTQRFEIQKCPEPNDYAEVLLKLLGRRRIASKNWVYRQYDHMVQDGTVVAPGSDAAVIRINLPARSGACTGSAQGEKYIAFTTDCNATYCYLDPFEGGKIAVAEAARNLVCSGARPLAVTDNLNFGNPMKPESFWQFRRCVEGVSEACQVFGTPVTGGNVSFYNESPAGAIDPTPTIGMLGLIDDPKHITTQWFKGNERRCDDLLLGEICETTPTFGWAERISETDPRAENGCGAADGSGDSRSGFRDFVLEIIRKAG